MKQGRHSFEHEIQCIFFWQLEIARRQVQFAVCDEVVFIIPTDFVELLVESECGVCELLPSFSVSAKISQMNLHLQLRSYILYFTTNSDNFTGLAE